MNTQYQLSDVAKNYLSAYHCILDEMIKGMSMAPLTDSISGNFIVQMIPHHMAAIEMSHNILKYTTNIPLQNIALNIITSQTESIENLRQAQGSCSELKNCELDVRLYQHRVNQILQTMFQDMSNARDTNRINCDFMWEMIPHRNVKKCTAVRHLPAAKTDTGCNHYLPAKGNSGNAASFKVPWLLIRHNPALDLKNPLCLFN